MSFGNFLMTLLMKKVIYSYEWNLNKISSMNIKTNLLKCLRNKVFIEVINVVGAFVSSKGIITYSYWPSLKPKCSFFYMWYFYSHLVVITFVINLRKHFSTIKIIEYHQYVEENIYSLWSIYSIHGNLHITSKTHASFHEEDWCTSRRFIGLYVAFKIIK